MLRVLTPQESGACFLLPLETGETGHLGDFEISLGGRTHLGPTQTPSLSCPGSPFLSPPAPELVLGWTTGVQMQPRMKASHAHRGWTLRGPTLLQYPHLSAPLNYSS